MLGPQGPVGPREAPGAQDKSAEHEAERAQLEKLRGARTEPAKPPRKAPQELGEITLTTEEVLALDLAMTRKQAAAAEEKLAALELKDAQAKLMSAVKGEIVMLARIANAHEMPNIRSAKLVGNKLIFQKE